MPQQLAGELISTGECPVCGSDAEIVDLGLVATRFRLATYLAERTFVVSGLHWVYCNDCGSLSAFDENRLLEP